MSHLFTNLTQALKENKKRLIVFPEGTDERILSATSKLAEEEILTPILIGEESEVLAKAKEMNVNIDKCKIINPLNYEKMNEMIDSFLEIRQGKTTKEEAIELLKTESYFGTMLVSMNEADGLVSGAVNSTSDTVRPALQIIKTRHGIKKTSGVFVMVRDHERYIFGDCAINIAPTSDDLAEIAVESHKTAKVFGIEPKIAMLSFSTKGSAQSEETERVVEAIAK